ncbi:cysteine desulfurase [Zooshikella ganghwensis]|uniref:cysteine desulfurase n=1 Tax=Zooshikella ganghwensis TaxID=202772 RepID=UPI000416317B|nr:cysteine desulfurase [Zooshikella ganghwensis]
MMAEQPSQQQFQSSPSALVSDGRCLTDEVRHQFPTLHQHVHGQPLVYLDNAATTQKPEAVLQALDHYYRCDNANVHRGVHALSERATWAMESARDSIQQFINAANREEVIFVRGTTEAINLIAHGIAESILQPGDEILISAMEHHANIVPWQLVCQRTQSVLKVIPMLPSGELDLEAFPLLLSSRTRLLAVSHVSNALGTVNPVAKMIAIAHDHGIPVLVDGAQAVAHTPVDVQALDCDFYVFSGHKVYGPTGIGILYGKQVWLDRFPPYQGGGEMIRRVSFDHTEFNNLPYKFEAGTPAIAEAIGLGAALQWFSHFRQHTLWEHEATLLYQLHAQLKAVPGVKIIGNAKEKTAVCSFTVAGIHPHDLGTLLDHSGIAVRAGHHCAMPVMDFFNVPATVRASVAIYNTTEDIARLINGLEQALEFWQ